MGGSASALPVARGFPACGKPGVAEVSVLMRVGQCVLCDPGNVPCLTGRAPWRGTANLEPRPGVTGSLASSPRSHRPRHRKRRKCIWGSGQSLTW